MNLCAERIQICQAKARKENKKIENSVRNLEYTPRRHKVKYVYSEESNKISTLMLRSIHLLRLITD